MKLTYVYMEEWLENLKNYWINKDSKSAASLFKKANCYQETPFLKPFTTFQEIEQEWLHIDNQKIKKLEFNILAIDKNTAIVNWIFERDIHIFNGIYELKFNDNLECIYFKSWEMEQFD